MNKPVMVAKNRTRRAHRVPLGQSVYVKLEAMIITTQLTPGAVFSETSLIRRFSFGRTPMREALQRLEWERLVKILPRRGILIAELNVASQIKLIEVRRELERPLARYAAQRATDEQKRALQEFSAAIQKTVPQDDAAEFIRISKLLYSELILAASNEYFHALDQFHGLSRRFWFAYRRGQEDLRDVVNAHSTRVQAIVDGDVRRAEETTEALMNHLDSFARATLSQP